MWRQVHTCLLFDMIARVMPRSLLCIVWDGVLFPVSLRSQRDPIFTEWWECLPFFCALKRSGVNCIGAFDWTNCIQSSSYISKHWSNPCVLDLVQRSIRIRPPENLISSTFIDESVPCYCRRVRARTPILNMSVWLLSTLWLCNLQFLFAMSFKTSYYWNPGFMNGRRMGRRSSRIMYIWKMASLLYLRLFTICGNPLKVSYCWTNRLIRHFELYDGTCMNGSSLVGNTD